MNLKDYQLAAARTLPNLEGKLLDKNDLNNYHMILGIETEASELADVFKKNLAYNKPIDWVNVSEEVADIFWYLVNFATINGIDLEQALTNNIDKLKVRYPEKFEENKAINRDISKEREKLEQI